MINNFSKDVLSYILIDTTSKLYTDRYLWNDEDEWDYLRKNRLVCRKWKYVIDKYFFRYIFIKSDPIDSIEKKLCYDSNLITTVETNNGQHFNLRVYSVLLNRECTKMYSRFIHGQFNVKFKYRMKKKYKSKKLKNKAEITIFIKPSLIVNKYYNKSTYWKDKSTKWKPQKITSEWKKMIANHLTNYILYRLRY